MSTRNTIVNGIKTQLQAITVANGFSYTQDSNYVFDWLDLKLDGDETALEIRDTGSSATDESAHQQVALDIEIAILEAGESSRASIRNKMSDILTAMKNFRDTNTVRNVTFLGDQVEFDRQSKLIGEAVLAFVIEYRTNLFEI